jgi:hypothetical protein
MTPMPKQTMQVALTTPDLGLTQPEINTLSRKFHNEVVSSLGGPEALARRRATVEVVVTVIDTPK